MDTTVVKERKRKKRRGSSCWTAPPTAAAIMLLLVLLLATATSAAVMDSVLPAAVDHVVNHQEGTGGGGGGSSGSGSGSRQSVQCPNCRQLADALRLEAIKHQILSKLGLKNRPNVTSQLPRDMVMETLNRAVESRTLLEEGPPLDDGPSTYEEEDDYYGRTSEIISFAQPGYTFNGQTLMKFSRPHSAESDIQVKSASLWVKVDYTSIVARNMRNLGLVRNRKITLYVFEVKPLAVFNTTDLSSKLVNLELLASVSSSLESVGWQKFEVTDAVQYWYARHQHDKLQILLDCSGCGKLVNAVLFSSSSSSSSGSDEEEEEHHHHHHHHHHQQQHQQHQYTSEWEWKQMRQQPFLVLQTMPLVPRRVRRRALECGPQVKQCCKQRFYVSFKQLGWDDWIIAPRGYYANYCRGDCGGVHRTPDTFINYHTHVMEGYRKVDWHGRMQPCCAPIKFSSMSLIYFGPDFNIIKRDLPKMVVNECGCP